jgi:hypothetical protein
MEHKRFSLKPKTTPSGALCRNTDFSRAKYGILSIDLSQRLRQSDSLGNNHGIKEVGYGFNAKEKPAITG